MNMIRWLGGFTLKERGKVQCWRNWKVPVSYVIKKLGSVTVGIYRANTVDR